MCKKRLLTMMVAIVMVLGMVPNYSSLSLTAHAAEENVLQDENGAIIEFRGGSLRMDYEEYDKTSFRFGYKITLPEGDWNVYINGEKAGTEVLETVEGTVSVAGISAVVLVQEGTNVALIVGIIVAALGVVAVAAYFVSTKKKAKKA